MLVSMRGANLDIGGLNCDNYRILASGHKFEVFNFKDSGRWDIKLILIL